MEYTLIKLKEFIAKKRVAQGGWCPNIYAPEAVGYRVWDIGVDAPITPDCDLPLLPLSPDGDNGQYGITLISGRAPIWQYAKALAACIFANVECVLIHDPRIGDVIGYYPDFYDYPSGDKRPVEGDVIIN